MCHSFAQRPTKLVGAKSLTLGYKGIHWTMNVTVTTPARLPAPSNMHHGLQSRCVPHRAQLNTPRHSLIREWDTSNSPSPDDKSSEGTLYFQIIVFGQERFPESNSIFLKTSQDTICLVSNKEKS